MDIAVDMKRDIRVNVLLRGVQLPPKPGPFLVSIRSERAGVIADSEGLFATDVVVPGFNEVSALTLSRTAVPPLFWPRDADMFPAWQPKTGSRIVATLQVLS